jgi:NADPH:quinone reductase-like Zn-dependent oxidoreductase
MSLLPGGGYAEQVTIPERMAMPIGEMDFVSAAAIPEAFLTSSEALLEEAQLCPNETVLVHAAASGVGSAAVQLAVALGARVVGTASANKCDFVRDLGASACVDYQTRSFQQVLTESFGSRPIDVIVDFVGASHWVQNQALLAERGRLVSIGVLGGSSVTLDLLGLLRRRQRVLGLVMRSRSNADKVAMTQRFIRKVWPLFQSGRLRSIVDRTFGLSDVRAAHEYMERNENLGKIVLTVSD